MLRFYKKHVHLNYNKSSFTKKIIKSFELRRFCRIIQRHLFNWLDNTISPSPRCCRMRHFCHCHLAAIVIVSITNLCVHFLYCKSAFAYIAFWDNLCIHFINLKHLLELERSATNHSPDKQICASKRESYCAVLISVAVQNFLHIDTHTHSHK